MSVWKNEFGGYLIVLLEYLLSFCYRSYKDDILVEDSVFINPISSQYQVGFTNGPLGLSPLAVLKMRS